MARRVWVAGDKGMVGSAIVRRLIAKNEEVLTIDRAELDLRNQAAVDNWIREEKPDAIVLAAARVGGILANDTFPAEFLYDNLVIETNIIHAAHVSGVDRLVFLGSSCIYPKFAPQPIKEEALLTSPLEPTNEWYAIAKIAGIKLCQAYRRQYGRRYISIIPCNLYGPNDNFDPKSGHVFPALIRRFHEAKMEGRKEVVVWGTGTPLREFLHVDDLADGVTLLMDKFDGEMPINCGAGFDVTIADLAHRIARVVGFHGEIVFDPTKPDGTPRKLIDSSRIAALGWKPTIGLDEGIADSYQWFRNNSRDRVAKRQPTVPTC
jgi:GDP-L-fucose synthase